MPNLTASLQRVPKWAWLTSAGVGIGGIAVYTMRNRAGVEDPADTSGDTGSTDAVTGYGTSSAPSPVPGIVVPDVNVQGSDGGGYMELQQMYLEALGSLLDGVGQPNADAGAGPLAPPITINLPNITGGGAQSTPRPGVVTAGPPPSQAPRPAPPAPKPCCTYQGHPLSWWHNPKNARRGNKWKWPFDGSAYKHSKPFRGNHACDGGGLAGKTKRDC